MAKERKLAFTYNAPVTLTFALISFIVLVIGWITGGKSTALCFEVYRSPLSFFWFVRLFGHVLGHASLTHFAGNMTLFLLLGPVLEEKYGHAILIEAFCVVAVVSGLVNVIFFSTALLGASGIVFMMIILVSASDLRRGEIPITMILVMVIYLGSELWTMVTSHDNVSQLTHIIGGLCGALIGALINSRHEK